MSAIARTAGVAVVFCCGLVGIAYYRVLLTIGYVWLLSHMSACVLLTGLHEFESHC